MYQAAERIDDESQRQSRGRDARFRISEPRVGSGRCSLCAFSCTVLFVSIGQVIGCEDRLRNDLYCVGWGVKLYSNQNQFRISEAWTARNRGCIAKPRLETRFRRTTATATAAVNHLSRRSINQCCVYSRPTPAPAAAAAAAATPTLLHRRRSRPLLQRPAA